jgi:imidazoleglycerol-phosphate dehydratase
MSERKATITRDTKETQIKLTLCIDGSGKGEASTGVGFFDHMLDLLTRHGLFDLSVHCTGDTHVDAHHTVEDVGISLGQAIKDALGDRKGIRRYGSCDAPMEDTLARVALDLGGRGSLVYRVEFPSPKVGDFDTELVEEFLHALAMNAGMNLHVEVPYGRNSHHVAEAVFKGLAKSLDWATQIDERVTGVPSTKGVL